MACFFVIYLIRVVAEMDVALCEGWRHDDRLVGRGGFVGGGGSGDSVDDGGWVLFGTARLDVVIGE